MDEQIAQSNYAETLEREKFEAWQADRLEDGYSAEESTEDAYLEYLEQFFDLD